MPISAANPPPVVRPYALAAPHNILNGPELGCILSAFATLSRGVGLNPYSAIALGTRRACSNVYAGTSFWRRFWPRDSSLTRGLAAVDFFFIDICSLVAR